MTPVETTARFGSWPWGILSALLSGALLAVSRDTGYWGALVLVAPVPVLLYAMQSRSARGVAALTFLAGVMAEAGLMAFYGRIIPVIFALAAFQAAIFSCTVFFMRGLYRRGPVWRAVVGYAAMTSALEYLFSLISPNGSFGAVGYALVDVLPLLQVASVGGVPALSCLAAIVPAGLTVACLRPGAGTAWTAWLVPMALALMFGFWSLAQRQGPSVRIALLSDDRWVPAFAPTHGGELAARDFATQLRRLEGARPAYAVLPEKLFVQTRDHAPIDPLLQSLSDETGIRMVVGFTEVAAGRPVNSARLFTPRQASATYLKRRMVPGLEREFTPGSGSLRVGEIGIAICKDMDFAPMIREYGGARLMLVPAWDFVRDGRLHSRMAVVRSVENGFAMARTASNGLLTLNDAHGRIVAERESAERPVSVVGDLPVGITSTIYSRVGDVFARVMIFVWAAFAALLVLRHSSGAPAVPPSAKSAL